MKCEVTLDGERFAMDEHEEVFLLDEASNDFMALTEESGRLFLHRALLRQGLAKPEDLRAWCRGRRSKSFSTKEILFCDQQGFVNDAGVFSTHRQFVPNVLEVLNPFIRQYCRTHTSEIHVHFSKDVVQHAKQHETDERNHRICVRMDNVAYAVLLNPLTGTWTVTHADDDDKVPVDIPAKSRFYTMLAEEVPVSSLQVIPVRRTEQGGMSFIQDKPRFGLLASRCWLLVEKEGMWTVLLENDAAKFPEWVLQRLREVFLTCRQAHHGLRPKQYRDPPQGESFTDDNLRTWRRVGTKTFLLHYDVQGPWWKQQRAPKNLC